MRFANIDKVKKDICTLYNSYKDRNPSEEDVMRVIDSQEVINSAQQVENVKKELCSILDSYSMGDIVPNKPVCKCSKGKYLIYDKQWLYDHLEAEFEHLIKSKDFIEGRVILSTDDNFDVQKFKEEMSKAKIQIMPKTMPKVTCIEDNSLERFVSYLNTWINENTSYYEDNSLIAKLSDREILENRPKAIPLQELGKLLAKARENEE